MITFEEFLEAQDWYSYRRKRGLDTAGYAGGLAPGSQPLPSISQNKIIVSRDITDLKMLHDRIIDSNEILPKDIAIFIKHFAKILSKLNKSIDHDIELSAGNWDFYANEINKYKVKHTDYLSSTNLQRILQQTYKLIYAENVSQKIKLYLKEALPLLKNMLKYVPNDQENIKSRRVRKQLDKRLPPPDADIIDDNNLFAPDDYTYL